MNFQPVPITTGRRFILLNRIRSAVLQMKLFENELVHVGLELKNGTISPDKAESLLEQIGATELLQSVVGLR